jgi:peptidoglycan/LPS O-acetylase OafA/YrhL
MWLYAVNTSLFFFLAGFFLSNEAMTQSDRVTLFFLSGFLTKRNRNTAPSAEHRSKKSAFACLDDAYLL